TLGKPRLPQHPRPSSTNRHNFLSLASSATLGTEGFEPHPRRPRCSPDHRDALLRTRASLLRQQSWFEWLHREYSGHNLWRADEPGADYSVRLVLLGANGSLPRL